MEYLKNALIIASAFVSVSLVLVGLAGFIRNETYIIDKNTYTAKKCTGKEARSTSLYYILAGIVWGILVYMEVSGEF